MKGLYTLVIQVRRTIDIKIGSLGRIKLSPGYYVYIGSGGANVLKRVARHFKREKRLRWHIDYLSMEAKPIKAYILLNPLVDEASLAEYLGKYLRYIPKFGASDSRYISHLFYLGRDDASINRLRSLIEQTGMRVLEYIG
jgi:Uri superfamily endonuclease